MFPVAAKVCVYNALPPPPSLPPSGTHNTCRGCRRGLQTAARPCTHHPRRGLRARTRDKVRPAQPLQRPIREKTRPTQPLQRPIRENTSTEGTKKPKLGCFEPAGRTISRSRPPSDRAGRTNSRTGHSHVARLKPTAPLQPLMQATVKPPSPLLAPEQQPLKPVAPLQPKNTPKTPISHPQRRCRFQLAHHTGPQRRHRFQTTAPRTATSPAGAEGVGGTVGYARASRRGAERSEVA